MTFDIFNYISRLNDIQHEPYPEMRNYASKNRIPIIQKDVVNFIKIILTVVKPATILEIGSAFGYSTMIMASCVNDCFIHCLELSKPACKQFKDTVKTYHDILSKNNVNIELFQGKAQETIKSLKVKYELIFIDARKDEYLDYIIHLEEISAKNAIIIADNCLWKGKVAFTNKDEKQRVKIMRDFNQFFFESKNYLTTILPVGDGILFSVKTI